MSSTVMGQMGAFHLHHIFHAKSALSGEKQCTLFECQMNVFSRKVVGDNIFMSPCGDGTAILKRGRPSHAWVQPFAVQRQYLHFSVSLRP